MFKEKKVLRKLLIFAGILVVLFLGFWAVWEICVGQVNRKYRLPGMELTEFDNYRLVGDLGEYYRLFPTPFPFFYGPQLTVSSGEPESGDLFLRFFPWQEYMKDYPTKWITSGTLDIYPKQKIDEGRYIVSFMVMDTQAEWDTGYGICVDAQGNYYIPPGVEVDAETEALARALLEEKREWLDYMFKIAKEAWGEELFEE